MKKVAVYGSLRAGFHNHRLLEDSELLGETAVPGKMYNLGGFPGLVPDNTRSALAEVYEVDEPTLARLDLLEGHPRFYKRTPIQTDFGDAVTYYLADPEAYSRHDIVESGDWADVRRVV